MPYIKVITGEIIQVAEKTAERVRNNRSSLHVDKATGIRFAGEHVVLIYPDEYDLVPTVEKLPGIAIGGEVEENFYLTDSRVLDSNPVEELPGDKPDKNIMDMSFDTVMDMPQGKLEEITNPESLNPDPIAGDKPMTIDEHNRESKVGALPKKPGRPKKK